MQYALVSDHQLLNIYRLLILCSNNYTYSQQLLLLMRLNLSCYCSDSFSDCFKFLLSLSRVIVVTQNHLQL